MVKEVVAAMWAPDTERPLFVRKWWPGSACEHVAVTWPPFWRTAV